MKIGDYIRTKFGRIGKIYNLEVDYSSELVLCEESSIPFSKHQIIKTSSNIIDLIEEGDYVNGYLVKYVNDNGVYIDIPFVDSESIGCNVDLIRAEDIKSIVTKEQFESMEYKVVE